ncbi:MAG: 50S ribosomal protein L6 [Deltaproteobacteria bacterium]|nr:50S ribosomal protein L6 [Deltaproteobacteria bacterium]
MSRIGIKSIAIPSGVSVETRNGTIVVKGSKGRLSRSIPQGITTEIDSGFIKVRRMNELKSTKALHGLTRSLLVNMVTGVTEGFSITLEIVGVGYKAELAGKNTITLSLGYSKPIEFSLREGISVEVEERGTRLIIRGVDKEEVGETAARIRKLRKPDSYKGKGIRYQGEILKLKPGKAGAKA